MFRPVGVVLVALWALAACAEVPPPTVAEPGVAAATVDPNSCDAPDAGFGCGPENIETAIIIVEPDPPDPVTDDRTYALTDAQKMQIAAEIWVAAGCVVREEDEDAFYEAGIGMVADRLGLTEAQRSGDPNRYVLEQTLLDGENLLDDAGRLEWDDQETRLVPCAA